MDMTPVAAQVILAIVPIVGIVIGGILVFFYLLWRHREISLQVKTGNYKPSKFDLKIFSLLLGIILTGIGSVLTLFFALISGLSYQVLGGLIPLALGVCFLIFYKVVSHTNLDNAK
jgi:sterol desaturase/sphingolipid hydroxylase (fatty acid hydroxylase superfamily)